MLALIMALSGVDYVHLAKTIQVEAAKGTMDEYCVAVSVLNRVRSPYYPNTVAGVVYVKGWGHMQVASDHRLVHCHHHQHFHRSIGLQI